MVGRFNNMEKVQINKKRDKKDKTNYSIKIVVRHLPPNMTEKEFLNQVDPLPENASFYYCPADWSLGQEATCRAYIDISLKDIGDVLQFRDRFDGYVFVDSKGVEYVAIVEYAPFQYLLKNKARSNDNKVNTIECELHFQEFLKKLTADREEANRSGDVKIDFTVEYKSAEKVKSTPLLQYLANKKERRRAEAKRRNEEKRKQIEEKKILRTGKQPDEEKSELGVEKQKPTFPNVQSKEGQEELKISRSKRRVERDQRRREEHEQRKLVQNRVNREERKTENNKSLKKHLKQSTQSNNHHKMYKEIFILKKDENVDTATQTAIVDDEKFEISKCTVGTNIQIEIDSNQENCILSDICKISNTCVSDDRRIRNKDRPSIAIYQPKVRLRLKSEDNSTTDELTNEKETSKALSSSDNKLPNEKLKIKRSSRANKQKSQDKTDDLIITR